MRISESFLSELISRADITDVVGRYVSLTKKSGSNLFGLCPFHNEKTPSFTVSSSRQFYHCFGCSEGGNVIGFIMKIENLDFHDAVEKLCQMVGMKMPEDEAYDGGETRKRRDQAFSAMREAAVFYNKTLNSDAGTHALRYLKDRGLNDRIIKNFGLGFAPGGWTSLLDHLTGRGFEKSQLIDAGLIIANKSGSFYDRFRNRVMFPIIDVRGSVIAFSGRDLDDSSDRKYINSPDSIIYKKSEHLFGMNVAKNTKHPRFILAEGQMDVIALHQAGFDCAVASLGTAFTDRQAKLLSRKDEVVIVYDADEAGVRAAARAIDILKQTAVSIKVLRLKGAKDPDEFIKKFGREAFSRQLEGSEADVEYRITQERIKFDIGTDEGKINYLKAAAKILAEVRSPIEQEVYANNVAGELGIKPEALIAEMKKYMSTEYKKERRRETSKALNPRGKMTKNMKYENPRSAAAEEGLIALILTQDDILKKVRGEISFEDFSCEFLGKMYDEALKLSETEKSPDFLSLSLGLSSEEGARLTEILSFNENASSGGLRDYINIIKKESLKRQIKENDPGAADLTHELIRRKTSEVSRSERKE